MKKYKYPLESGVLIGPVSVGFVEKPDTVWVSLDGPREELMDKVEVAKLGKLEEVDVGLLAATIFSEDEALYRVEVLSKKGTEVEVRYCDYGNVGRKAVKELYMLPDDLASQQKLAVKVKVEGVKRRYVDLKIGLHLGLNLLIFTSQSHAKELPVLPQFLER